MTVKEILTPVILQEFKKYENLGHQIKLKTTTSRRIKYSIICGIIALLGFVHPVYFVAVPVYIVLMLKTKNNVDLIFLKRIIFYINIKFNILPNKVLIIFNCNTS